MNRGVFESEVVSDTFSYKPFARRRKHADDRIIFTLAPNSQKTGKSKVGRLQLGFSLSDPVSLFLGTHTPQISSDFAALHANWVST